MTETPSEELLNLGISLNISEEAVRLLAPALFRKAIARCIRQFEEDCRTLYLHYHPDADYDDPTIPAPGWQDARR